MVGIIVPHSSIPYEPKVSYGLINVLYTEVLQNQVESTSKHVRKVTHAALASI